MYWWPPLIKSRKIFETITWQRSVFVSKNVYVKKKNALITTFFFIWNRNISIFLRFLQGHFRAMTFIFRLKFFDLEQRWYVCSCCSSRVYLAYVLSLFCRYQMILNFDLFSSEHYMLIVSKFLPRRYSNWKVRTQPPPPFSGEKRSIIAREGKAAFRLPCI